MKKYKSDFFWIQEMIRRFINHNINATGAQMAYFLLLMVFPFLMFIIAVLGFLSIPTYDTIYFLSGIVPKEVNQIMGKYVEYILTEKQGDLLLFSAVASFWTASNALGALTYALNAAYGIKESRNYFKKKLLVIPFTFLVIVCICVALTIPILGKGFLVWISKYISISTILIEYLRYLRWVVAIFTIFNVASVLYYIAPNTKVRYVDIIPGAAFATVGWIVISTIISIYFNNVRGYSTIYGSIGAIIILMIWLFWGSIIIILGGEVNAMVADMRLFKNKHNVISLNKKSMKI